MFFPKSAFCRIYQTAFRAALPILPYREPEIADSSAKLGEIIQKEKVKSVLIVTDKGIVSSGLTEPIMKALETSKTVYTVYDKTRPNPTVDNVEEAYSLYRKNECDCLIAVGGGSSMDCAKAVGARAAYQDGQNHTAREKCCTPHRKQESSFRNPMQDIFKLLRIHWADSTEHPTAFPMRLAFIQKWSKYYAP